MPSRRHAFWPVPEEPRQLRRPGVSRFPVRQRAAGQVLDSMLQRILTRSWPSATIAAGGSGSCGARGDIEQLARPWTCCRGSLPGAGRRRIRQPRCPGRHRSAGQDLLQLATGADRCWWIRLLAAPGPKSSGGPSARAATAGDRRSEPADTWPATVKSHSSSFWWRNGICPITV